MDKALRESLINKLKEFDLVDTSKTIVIKAVDHSGNKLSPVKVVYKISYWDLMGNKQRAGYYGEKFGFQR